MVVASAIYLCLIVSRLEVFCKELIHQFQDQTVQCPLLINQFSLNNTFAVQPSQNYMLTVTFAWLTLALWTFSVIVMAARCYLGIDFETLVSAPPPYPNGVDGGTINSGKRGVVCTVNEKTHIFNEKDDLDSETVAMVMNLNGKELKLSTDRANRFVDTIDEDQEMTGIPNTAFTKRIRLINEVGRQKIPKSVRLKSYSNSSA